MEDFILGTICLIGGIIFGIILEFAILVNTMQEGEYIVFRTDYSTASTTSYYIKDIQSINNVEYKLTLKKRY